MLLRHAPQETVDLVRELCGLRHEDENDPTSAMISTGAGASRLHELLPIFLGDLPQLELVLRSVLLSSGPCPVPPDEAGRLFPTLFELMVRSYRELEQDGDESVRRRLHGDIMWLLRQYQHEDCDVGGLVEADHGIDYQVGDSCDDYEIGTDPLPTLLRNVATRPMTSPNTPASPRIHRPPIVARPT